MGIRIACSMNTADRADTESRRVDELSNALSYQFVQNALLAGLLASIQCGVIGAFVVVKRLVFVSGGISHAAFGGMGIAYFLGAAPILGAVLSAGACALLLGTAGSDRFRSHDALIGVLWAVGMAVGIVFIQLTPGYAPDLMAYLFGDILAVTPRALAIAAVLDVAVLGLVFLLFKELVAVSFDEPFAAVQGVNVRVIFSTLMLLIALSVVGLIQVVGIILVIALLSIPPLIALRFTRSFSALLAGSVSAGLVMTLLGLALAYRYDLPSGPAIILTGASLLGAAMLIPSGSQRPPRTA
jgi:zinc transport system permease protein